MKESRLKSSMRPKTSLWIPALLTLSISLGETQWISCPVLTCDANIDQTMQMQIEPEQNPSPSDSQVCYLHDNQQPTQQLRTYTCSGASATDTMVCGLDLGTSSLRYAWFSESTQFMDSSTVQGASLQANSDVYLKRTKATCLSASSFVQNLQNGRQCNNDNQCYSKHCVYDSITATNRCSGLNYGQYCHNHADCNNGYFCNKTTSWPFTA